ncbi:MAG TPA: adenylate/guanylate cyclase domain-containing protein [Polyangiaceae bacterium]|nr:adenylate/guanylate cyclase domain-containing protein [Polyangiaceae bacterium]
MARLILTTAEGTQAVELRPVNSLGRHPNNTIQLLDKIVSKEHCIIEQRGDHYVLRDLGSLNGTFINNERVRGEAMLKHADEIALGATRGRFEDAPAQGARPPQQPQPPAQQPQQGGYGGWPMNQQQGQSPLAQSGAMQYGRPAGPASGGPTPGPMPPGPVPPGPVPPGPVPPGPVPPGQVPMPGAPGYPYPMVQARVQPLSQMPPSVGPGSAGIPPTAHQPQPPGMVQGGYPQAGGTAPIQGRPQTPNFTIKGGGITGFVPVPAMQNANISVSDQERQIGTQIDAVEKGFVPFDRIASDMNQLRADYERLRLSQELSHAIGVERDTTKLLDKVLASVLKFITADRAVIFLRNDAGELQLCASKRRDGTNAPITVSSTILAHVCKERAAVLTHDAAMDFAASKGKSMILNRISSAIVAPMLQHDNEVLGVLWLDSETLARFQAKDLELIQTVANQAARFIEINILGKKVEAEAVSRERLSRLLSPNIAERVISGQLEVKQGGQRVEECTVFNSDIRGFTRMSESTPPEALVDMLNDYFELMVELVFKYDGTLDKFMGDGIMALWGAPVQTPDDPIRAVECALEMEQSLGEFNRNRLERDLQPLAVGIGIHTGPLVAGYIGSSKALSYTVIGDSANTSARLCSVALSGQIIVSENTLVRLKNKFDVEELQPAKVKGKEKPLRIYNVLRRATKVAVPSGNPFAAEPTSAVNLSNMPGAE